MPDFSVSFYPTQYRGRMRKSGILPWPCTEVSGRADRKYHPPEGRSVRMGMSCAGIRMLAWIWGHLLNLSMLMPSWCCAQCPQLCIIACFAHVSCARLRDSGRYWHSILCLHLSWRLLSHKNDSEGDIWTAGSLLARKVCVPEGKEFSGCIAGMYWISNDQTAPRGCSLASWTR